VTLQRVRVIFVSPGLSEQPDITSLQESGLWSRNVADNNRTHCELHAKWRYFC